MAIGQWRGGTLAAFDDEAPPMDIFNLNELLAQMILALGAALVIGNGYALIQARRGRAPKGMEDEGQIRRGRAWWLIAVGLVIAVWGFGSLIAL